MKHTRLLCIQGKYAPTFFLKNQCAHHFRSLIESVTLSNAIVISSRYKSDVIYSADKNITTDLIKMWTTYQGIPYTDRLPEKFTSTDSGSSFLEYYFIKLAHLSMRNGWYRDYCRQFTEVCSQEPDHSLLKPIIACNQYLKDASIGELNLPEIPLRQLKFSIESFNSLAESAKHRLSKN